MRHEIIEQIFDKYASQYATKYKDQSLYISGLEFIVKELAIKDPDILDIACGPGNLTKVIFSYFPEANITGIDISSRMLAIAKKELPSVRFEKISSTSMGSFMCMFDLIAAGFLLPYLNDAEIHQLLTDSFSLLKPHGLLYLSTMIHQEGYKESDIVNHINSQDSLPTYYHTERSITEMATKTGLKLIYSNTIQNPEYTSEKIFDLIVIFRKQL